MLKRITLAQIRAGMFIEDVEGDWDSNPLQTRRVLLTPVTVNKLKASSIRAVVINTARGVDASSTPDFERRVSADGAGDAARQQTAECAEVVQRSASRLSEIFVAVRDGGEVSFEQTVTIAHDISGALDVNPALFIAMTRLRSKDETTFVHSVAVSALMIHFGRYLRLGEDAAHLLGVAGLLHDVGKVELPQAILGKEGALNKAEVQMMRGHPVLGFEILSQQDGMPDIILDVCRHHHERVDGRGYPDRLSGASFTFAARLAAICDVYDAITSARPYKRPWSSSDALKWMLKRDGHFDRQLLKKFILCLAVSQPLSA